MLPWTSRTLTGAPAGAVNSRLASGAAAASGQTQLVPDVHAFPGHIACDGRSQSELVVPVFGPDGALIAVLDVDSDQPAAFDEVDARWLERILAATFSQ